MNRLEPFTGFGDATNTSIKFAIRAEKGTIEDWKGAVKGGEIEIPNSDRTIRQKLGRKPYTLTVEILLSAAAKDALESIVGQAHTLRYLWGLTNIVGGMHEVLLGKQYLKLPDTELVSMDVITLRDRGPVIARVTFRRTPDNLGDVYGFARYS